MKTISRVFSDLQARRSGALIGYITAGDPHSKHTPAIAEALVRGGVDILELGLPFSDPIADGPVIQKASVRALKAGATPKVVFQLAKQISDNHDVPLVIMSYFNPIFRMGLANFFQTAKSCRVNGIIVPDLPIEEAAEYRRFAADAGVDTIFLVAPSTKADRIRQIVDGSSGFVYLVSRLGVTGIQSSVSFSTIQLVQRVLPFTRERIPLAVGFGVSKPEHANDIINAGADGVIVGSVFVEVITRNLHNPSKMLKELEMTAKSFKQAISP